MVASASPPPPLASRPLFSPPAPVETALCFCTLGRLGRRRTLRSCLGMCHALVPKQSAAVPRGLSNYHPPMRETSKMLLQQRSLLNIEIFVRASFDSLFQLLIISSRSRGRPSPPCASSLSCPPLRRRCEPYEAPLLLFLSVLPSLLAASEETRPVAGGRRLKERAAKGAKNKKSKGDKSGKNEHQNIFNVDHEDACASHMKKKGRRMHKECRWTKSHGCVEDSTPGQNPPQSPGGPAIPVNEPLGGSGSSAIPVDEPLGSSGYSCEECLVLEQEGLFNESKCPSACWHGNLV